MDIHSFNAMIVSLQKRVEVLEEQLEIQKKTTQLYFNRNLELNAENCRLKQANKSYQFHLHELKALIEK